jgi:hypothetical protein
MDEEGLLDNGAPNGTEALHFPTIPYIAHNCFRSTSK